MPAIERALVVILICILFIVPVGLVGSPSPDRDQEIDGEIDNIDEPENENSQTRASTGSRANFEIFVNSPLTMPEVYSSWNQSDWSGGAGQNVWSETDKFNISSGINSSTPDEQLELGPGDFVEAWKRVKDGPEGRYRHTMTWAESRGVFYMFGGHGPGWTTTYNDLWEYNPATDTWTEKGQSGGPSTRQGQTMVWDSVHDLLWIFGGNDGDEDDRFNDLWSYNPVSNSWSQKAFAFDDKCYAAGAFDPNSQQIIIYGGYAGSWNNPSHEVWAFNTTTNLWSMKHNYTRRVYHDATWCEKTKSMFFYGGASQRTGGGGGTYTYVDQLNEYFPQMDTWVNHSGTGDRVRPILAYDSKDEKLLMHGGGRGNDDYRDINYYDIDLGNWFARMESDMNDRDYADGDWDTINNQFVTYGGLSGWDRLRDTWLYNPSIQGFAAAGDLVSSVFSPGHRINPTNLAFNVTHPVADELGTNPVKIRIAGSASEQKDVVYFVGWDYSVSSYFSDEAGRSTPSELNGKKYLAYKVNLSTEHPLYTPELNWVRIDYYIYPDEYTYDSPIYPVGPDLDLPLRYVNWTSDEPEGTSFDVFFRQAQTTGDLSLADWEKVSPGQTEFGLKGGKYLQYRVIMKTTEVGYTPELTSIKFIFNVYPTKPDLILPMDDEWVGTSKPTFTWKFNDPDETDHQSGFQIYIAIEDTFTYLAYSTNEIDLENNSFTIDKDLEEGEYYWKIMLRDNYGSWSPWSDVNYLIVDTGRPTTPKIESYSHPLEHIYYSNSRVDLHWNEPNDPSGISGYSYILDASPDAEPVKNISMTTDDFNSKYKATDFQGLVTFDNVADGTWYFHLIASDALGTWSDKATRIIKVDTVAPTFTDHTPVNITSGQSLKFMFELADALSGVDITTISWRYENDVDYQFDELAEDVTGNYTLQHQVKTTTASYIEYYIEISDLAESANVLRHPKSATNKINLVDTEPPVIIDTTGSKTHNQFTNLEIFVKATDNVGVTEAKIYFNDQVSGKIMTKGAENTFTFKIDRVELEDYSGYTDNNSILYKVMVWDYQANSAGAPDSGNYVIKIEEIEDTPDKPEEEVKDEGFSQSILLYLLILIVIVVVVALVLFMFIRKSKEDIDEDRHKLRMAIADVHEAAAAGGTPLESAPTGIAPMAGGDGQGPAIDIQAQSMGAPSLEPQQQPVGYLPEAPMYTDESMAEPTADQAAQQAGLLTSEQPQAQSDMPQVVPTPTAAGAAGGPEAKVEIDGGLAVSLPGDAQSPAPEPQPQAPSPTEESTETGDKKFWKPPEPPE